MVKVEARLAGKPLSRSSPTPPPSPEPQGRPTACVSRLGIWHLTIPSPCCELPWPLHARSVAGPPLPGARGTPQPGRGCGAGRECGAPAPAGPESGAGRRNAAARIWAPPRFPWGPRTSLPPLCVGCTPAELGITPSRGAALLGDHCPQLPT